ncbi:hypothetical protein ACP70R_009633 [Stipagrostis hirtigluma subsp. patula]
MVTRGGCRRRARMWRRGGRRGGGGGGEQEEEEEATKGPWSAEEDEVLRQHVREHGPRNWSSIQSKALLRRTGKSCRLRWVNKLRPGLKTGCKFSPEEQRTVISLQAKLGNKWATIAAHLTGRTDNDVKNFWSTRQKRQARRPSPMAPRQAQGPCSDMIPFQETAHHVVGQSSGQEPPRAVESYQRADAPFPTPVSLLPPAGFPTDASGCGAAADPPALLLPFGGHGGKNRGFGADTPTFFLDSARFADVEPPAPLLALPAVVSPPSPLFGLDDYVVEPLADYYELLAPPPRRGRLSDVHFDDLTPETLDFFSLPPPPPPPPPSN